jgi:hypothetical protein
MIGKMPLDQGRARGLYDEQLQRKQQEKALVKGGLPGIGPALFTLTAPVVPEPIEKVG